MWRPRAHQPTYLGPTAQETQAGPHVAPGIQYQPNETERMILYLVLFGYFVLLIIIWFIKRKWKQRKDQKTVERYAL